MDAQPPVVASPVVGGQVVGEQAVAEQVVAEQVVAGQVVAGQVVAGQVVAGSERVAKPVDSNESIYYRNRFEFSLESGVLPINTPFVFDVFVGGDYSEKPLKYTLVPIFPSLRWQFHKLRGPIVLRGNTELMFTLSYTAIPRGPETRYAAFDAGIRRNFVPHNWRATPYFEARGGIGYINAKEPHGVPFAQGQDRTYTLMVGSGVRYNFTPRYSMAAGVTYMHVSNAFQSEPKYPDNGINVYGPFFGFNVRLGKAKGATR